MNDPHRIPIPPSPGPDAVSAVTAVRAALAARRYETARRLLRHPPPTTTPAEWQELLWLHYDVARALGEPRTALAMLQELSQIEMPNPTRLALCQAEIRRQLTGYEFYRTSAEARDGLGYETYAEQCRIQIDQALDRALAAADTDDLRLRVAAALVANGRHEQGETLRAQVAARSRATAAAPDMRPPLCGAVSGELHFPDQTPVADCTVVLGLAVEIVEQDPASFNQPDMHYYPRIGSLRSLESRTDSQGKFAFAQVPAGRHAFLAVRLDPDAFDVATRFVAHGLTVTAGGTTTVEATVDEWRSAPPEPFEDVLPAILHHGGRSYRKQRVERLRNPFYYDFPRQPYEFQVDRPPEPGSLLVSFDPCAPSATPAVLPFQAEADSVVCLTDLPARSDRLLALYTAEPPPAATPAAGPSPAAWLPQPDPDGTTAVIDTGCAAFRIAWGTAAHDATPPLLSVRGADGIWRGQGRFVLPAGVTVAHRITTVLSSGPLLLKVRTVCTLSQGATYALEFTAYRDEACLLVREQAPADLAGAFEFALPEFGGGRGFVHWTPENGSPHWHTLTAENTERVRLQESVMWWHPQCAFAYAMTAEGLEAQDYIGVFSLRRGDWIDRAFARIAQGPDDGNRELDWPYPEMIGSTISMITARTTSQGDACFRFGFFDGERQWGLLVSTLAQNDGPWKELSRVQHKFSSPRLNDFCRWQLDVADTLARPLVVAQRNKLRALRRKRNEPGLAQVWQRIASGENLPGPAEGVRFVVDGDPLIAWRKKLELVGVAHIRCRMTLLGRDHADMYSPVGARPITAWAEDYDLIAASGVFTPDEERLVRRFLMLMGHMHLETDLMNWRYGARNANFEADRVDVVGTVGLVFEGNPDAQTFVRHATEQTYRALDAYCTPGSGKWYENPPCYYLQALKCRINLLFHLWHRGRIDPAAVTRLPDFLRWGVLLLTPPFPIDAARLATGYDVEAYRAAPKARRVPPIGDHAGLGTWVPEHFALMGRALRGSDPELADLLAWAYQNGGSDGRAFGNLPLLFTALESDDLRPAPPAVLTSRRLEGFGSVFRGAFGTDREFYLLFKQGPGGYRYHRTEGSLLLFADYTPLVYDGGEAGETWRHSTLSFHAAHTPLAPGHVERFHSDAAVDFCQGVHPKALDPGEPTFLSDDCNAELVAVAHARFLEPRPAVSRSICWVKDEYVVIHDELDLPDGLLTHWHLQVVADAHTYDAAGGYRFAGRYGTDLQVLLPEQEFAETQVRQDPVLLRERGQSFTLRHLQLSRPAPRGIVAILRPLAAGQAPVAARLLRQGDRIVGVQVHGDGIADTLFFSRQPLTWNEAGLRFEGRYGACLRHAGQRTFVDLDRTVGAPPAS